MAKFIELEQAAEMLGVSPQELNDMRLRGDIYGVRDGATWKFKTDEVARVADERGVSPATESEDAPAPPEQREALDASDLDLNFEAADADSPTAIGSIEDFEDLGAGMGSSTEVAEPAPKQSAEPEGSSSDVALVPDDDGSSVNLVAESGSDLLGSDLGIGSSPSDDLGFEGSDLNVASDVALDDNRPASSAGSAGGSELSVEGDDELALGDDDELVLEGSGDVTGGSGDTGINLTSPSDSGLNLEEEPVDLAGSSVSSLELPEDEDIIDLDDLEGGSDAPVQADEPFSLTPSADAGEDEDDSGSQVIALEDSEGLEEAATVLATGEGLEGPAELDTSMQPTQAPVGAYGAAPETPYSVYNILGLLAVVVVLALSGMLMVDLVRNMWSWDQPYNASTSIMDMMVQLFGMDP